MLPSARLAARSTVNRHGVDNCADVVTCRNSNEHHGFGAHIAWVDAGVEDDDPAATSHAFHEPSHSIAAQRSQKVASVVVFGWNLVITDLPW